MRVRLVALLRGINVGRAKRVEMAKLRALLTDLGYGEVRTLLQSGNAVFTCEPAAAETAAADIERAVAEEVGVQAKVVVRTVEELAAAIAADPLGEVATDPSRHLLGFLAEEPEADAVRDLTARDFGDDRLEIVGWHCYLWCPAGVLASPFAKLDWERTLGVAATMRNWSTVTKLAALANT